MIKSYSIGQLARAFSLSRSTLIYYDKIGLLCASQRSENNYRRYTQADYKRLEKITAYKHAGLALSEVSQLLNRPSQRTAKILEDRLMSLNQQIAVLREQQRNLIKLLGKPSLLRNSRVISKSQWVKLLSDTGMDETAMRQWHIEFERAMPEAHTDFLQSLGIEARAIKEIKRWSQAGQPKAK